jgi:signal transduction histidine kinase
MELTIKSAQEPARLRTLALSAFPVAGTTDVRLGIVIRDVTDVKALALLEERERIARDLHDGAIQSLFAVTLALGAQERLLRERKIDQARTGLRNAIGQVNRVIQDIRNYIFDLRLDDLGAQSLTAGLRALSQELRINALVEAEIALDLEADADGVLDAATAASVLHIAREATSNVIRHAAATQVTIGLARLDERRLRLTIRDNGRGLDAAQNGGRGGGERADGQGLQNMAARAALIRGELQVISEPGRGTEVRVDVPVPERPGANG